MAKQPSCTGVPFFGSPIDITLTYPAMKTSTGLTTVLPTTEPATAQISYTIEEGDLPSTSIPIPYRLAIFLPYAIYNGTGSARLISWRHEINGSSVNTSYINVGNNYYLSNTLSIGAGYATPLVVGDVITVKLWGAASGIELRSHSFFVVPTRILYGTGTHPVWIAPYNTSGGTITRESIAPTPSWASSMSSYGYMRYYIDGNDNQLLRGSTTVEGTSITPIIYVSNTYGIGAGYWDAQTLQVNSYVGPNTFVYSEKRPTLIRYYPIKIPI